MKSNLPYLFYSRKFWLAVVGVAQIVALDFLGVDPALWQAIAALLGVLIMSIAYEDAAGK